MHRALRLAVPVLLAISTFAKPAFAQDAAQTGPGDAKPAQSSAAKNADKKQSGKKAARPADQASQSATASDSTTAEPKKDEDPLLKPLNWRLVGPYRGGRVLAVS